MLMQTIRFVIHNLIIFTTTTRFIISIISLSMLKLNKCFHKVSTWIFLYSRTSNMDNAYYIFPRWSAYLSVDTWICQDRLWTILYPFPPNLFTYTSINVLRILSLPQDIFFIKKIISKKFLFFIELWRFFFHWTWRVFIENFGKFCNVFATNFLETILFRLQIMVY